LAAAAFDISKSDKNSASTVITLADWYHVPSKQQSAPLCVGNLCDSFTLVYPDMLAHWQSIRSNADQWSWAGLQHNAGSEACGSSRGQRQAWKTVHLRMTHAVIASFANVVPLDSYRLRLVSISCDPNFVFSIDGHNMTIIEVDGQNHQPLTVDSIQIFAGLLPTF
jgi:FtsP/CotA-like multicopper oxidase with cupredoxin domain